MRALTKAQRIGILERLKHNHKYSAVVSYQGKHTEQEALEFASVLEEAGWIVSGPHVNEHICAEGVEIGVRDPASPCPSAHLLLDVLVSAGLNARLVKTAEPLPTAFSSSCCLQLGRLKSGGVLERHLNAAARFLKYMISGALWKNRGGSSYRADSQISTVETRWDEKAGLRRDAVRSQVIDVLEAQIKGDRQ